MSRYDVKQEVTDKYSLRGRVFHKLREDILNGKYKENEEDIHSGRLNYMFLEISKEVRRKIQPIGK